MGDKFWHYTHKLSWSYSPPVVSLS